MKIALAQLSTTVGDVAGNARRVERTIARAALLGADVVVFPELCVTGYPPRDLLLDPALARAAAEAVERLAFSIAPGVTVIVGSVVDGPPGPTGRTLRNAAVVLAGGRVQDVRAKALLPCDDVFLEPRWFTPEEAPARPVLITLRDGRTRRVGLLVCEDLWDEAYARSPARELIDAGAEALLCLNASPFRRGVQRERLRLARRPGVPLVYVNAVGAEDDLVFDGASFAVDARGRLLATLPEFDEGLAIVDLDDTGAIVDPEDDESADESADDLAVRAALVLGLRDFARKNRLGGVVIGISGGVDSALVAALAVDALGASRVVGVQLPSRFTSQRSLDDSHALCDALGVRLEVVPLEPLHAASETVLAACLPGGLGATTAENVQARLRGLVLMAFVNRTGGLLLNTSNKTELTLGYGTLYGDMCGGLAPIADLTKPEVWRLAALDPRIPRAIVERTPTAELKPDQVDPFDYPRISPLVEALVQGTPPTLAVADASATEVAALEDRIAHAEFKRRQAPPGLKVSARAFGPGRLIPVTHRHRSHQLGGVDPVGGVPKVARATAAPAAAPTSESTGPTTGSVNHAPTPKPAKAPTTAPTPTAPTSPFAGAGQPPSPPVTASPSPPDFHAKPSMAASVEPQKRHLDASALMTSAQSGQRR